MRTCIPSPGPIWATWLKLVGLEISLDLISGSLSISLWDKQTLNNDQLALIDRMMRGCSCEPCDYEDFLPSLLYSLLFRDLEEELSLAARSHHQFFTVVWSLWDAQVTPFCRNNEMVEKERRNNESQSLVIWDWWQIHEALLFYIFLPIHLSICNTL